MKRVGVFICHCGTNIASAVDCEAVARNSLDLPGVVYSTDYKYMCAQVGQELIQQAVSEHSLERIVVASCSPRMHENTFRKCLTRAGLNPYFLEMANIREQCAWVHPNQKEKATQKALDLVRMAVSKVLYNEALKSAMIPITKRALVIGGGIAGIQVALDIANAGYHVDLVEKEPSIGGHMAQIDKTFPTLDCSACILTPKMVEVANHELINLLTYAEIEKVEGFIGNFEVTIRRKASFVNREVCTGCGICTTKCPTKVPSEFEMQMGLRKAIYTPFPQAIPNKPIIDQHNCRYLTSGQCGICEKLCPVGAIEFTQKDQFVKERYGAIVVATGFDLFSADIYGEYGYGKYEDVISALEFERLVNASGPTMGVIQRPSDNREPKNIVFIQCVGSRDEAKGKAYCSKVCCMYTAKQALLVHEKIKDSQTYVFYLDIRTAGKGYEEFYTRASDQPEIHYLRGRVSKIYKKDKQLIVKGEDTLLGRPVEVEADLVVLATAMIAQKEAVKLAQTVGFSYDRDGFYTEAHPKLAPVETFKAGVFLAGACQGPKDIPESVAQAGAAAVKVCGLFSKNEMAAEPSIAMVDENLCTGCALCLSLCPYGALELKTIEQKFGETINKRKVAKVNSGLCQGCGVCTVACNTAALNLKHFTNQQILAEVDALCL